MTPSPKYSIKVEVLATPNTQTPDTAKIIATLSPEYSTKVEVLAIPPGAANVYKHLPAYIYGPLARRFWCVGLAVRL